MPARATSAFSSAGAAHASRLGKIGRSVPEGERWIVTNWADGTVIDPLTELEFGISGKKQKRADIGGVDALGKSAGSMPGAIAENARANQVSLMEQRLPPHAQESGDT
jgi:hypothetical protein